MSPVADSTPSLPPEGRRRVQIEGVTPEVEAGRFPVKRVVGERLTVEADIFCDGHDRIAAVLRHRPPDVDDWSDVRMELLGNDRWRASVPLEGVGRHRYTLTAWVDPFLTWRTDLVKWVKAGADVSLELQEGGAMVAAAAERAAGRDAEELERWARRLRTWASDEALIEDPSPLLGEEGPVKGTLPALMDRHVSRELATRYPRILEVTVDRERAAFSAWYEFFPRSTAPEPGGHGTLQDARSMLPYVRDMGFDVVYLPPIHPIGRTRRKGPNNRIHAEEGDPGSPWAIGGPEGGHTAVHPRLGTLDDFDAFRADAESQGLEVAMDVAFQCSPDHPWVQTHPEWFRTRPDGSIRHAENPPKRYEDIYPLDFETEAWRELWVELRDVFTFWMDRGVRIFRVDNPHTKALPFWDWVVGELKAKDPGVILLSEAFTRPRMMYRLAKLGFTQSYTYFTWRNTRHELTSYLEELVTGDVCEYFRPNFWPNTPDILTEFLQTGGRPAFALRLVLAAGLSSNYGIYGPAFELAEADPREPGSEEYRDSEKYQIRSWDLDREESLRDLIARMNQIRRENPALHRNRSLRFHPSDNDRLLVWSKVDPTGENRILFVVNLDPHHTQSGWVKADHPALGLDPTETVQVEDLLGGGRYLWEPERNFVRLDPAQAPAHVFRVRRRLRSEEDFEYF